MSKVLRAGMLAAVIACAAGGRGTRTQEGEAPDPFGVSANVRGDYTDNRDATENNEQSTFDLYLSPRFDVNLLDASGRLNAYYEPAVRYRTDPSDTQNDIELYHDLSLNGEKEFTPSDKLMFKELFQYTDDPSVDLSGATVRGDRSYIRNRANAEMRHGFSRLSYGEVGAAHMLKRYDDADAAAESDEDRLDFGVNGWRQFTSTLGAVLSGSYSLFGLESPHGIQRDFDVVTGAAGIDKVFSPQLRGSAKAGLQNVQYDDPGLSSTTEPFFEVQVRAQTVPTLRLEATFLHGVRDADVYPFASQVYDEGRGRVEWDSTPLVTFGASGTYRLSSYDADGRPGSAPDAVGVADGNQAVIALRPKSGDETTIVLQGDVAVQVSDQLKLRFAQRFEDVDSDVAESFTKNTSSVSASLAF